MYRAINNMMMWRPSSTVSSLWNDLQAYYTADNTPNDTLGNHNGTMTNGTTYGTGIINQGFSLDGVNDYVSILPTFGSSFSAPTSAHSYSAWVYKTVNGQKFIIQNGNVGMGTCMIVTSGNNLGMTYQGVTTIFSSPSGGFITLNTWIHCAMTYDGAGNVNLYKNGVNVGSSSISWTDGTGTSSTYLGTYLGTSNYFNGLIDEVGIWDRELTQSEVTELYNSGSGKQYPTGIDAFWSGALSYFKANNTAYDEIAGYTGTLNNGTTYDTGIIDSAFSFDRSLTQSITTTSPSHNFATDTTYNMWIKPSSLPGFCMFLHIPSGTQGPGIGLRPGGNLTFFRASVNNDLKSGITISTGVWQMITIVYRSGGSNNVDFYVNGSLLHTGSLSVGAAGGSNMYIGSNGATNGVYDGLIDEVSIWDSALSPSKISQLYNSTVGLQYPNGNGIDAVWDDLLAYYTADNTPNDAIGSNNGTLVNGATYGTGIINQGFSLDGVNDYVDMGNVLDFDGTTPFSFNFWINTSTSSFRYLFSKRRSTGDFTGYSIMINADNTIEFQLAHDTISDRIRCNSIDTYTTSTLSMITVSYDGTQLASGITIDINNTSSSINTRSDGLVSSISNIETFKVGALGSGNYFGGVVDEIGIWNRVLTPSEKTELYNGGSALQYS